MLSGPQQKRVCKFVDITMVEISASPHIRSTQIHLTLKLPEKLQLYGLYVYKIYTNPFKHHSEMPNTYFNCFFQFYLFLLNLI